MIFSCWLFVIQYEHNKENAAAEPPITQNGSHQNPPKIGLMHARQAFTCSDILWLKSCESRQLGKWPVMYLRKLLLRQYNDNCTVTSFKQVPQPSPHSWSLLAALDDHGISCLPMLPLYHNFTIQPLPGLWWFWVAKISNVGPLSFSLKKPFLGMY